MGRNIGKFIALLAGLLVGFLLALWSAGMLGSGRGLGSKTISVAGWQSDWTIGSPAAGMVTRAWVARHGLLALAKEEAVYFTRAVDDSGAPLDASCDYVLTGGDQPSQWWSITLYDGKSRLPMNEDDALSLDRTKTGGADAWLATISAVPPAESGFWISSRNADEFDLTLRLYRPDPALLEAPEIHLNPPSVRLLSCRRRGGR
ncbi:MAG: DUF1214 domain-containing protein [Hyphomonadaceae bacterium]|nr:DUF1214 domain-containing protein [Hyphomonadaceae bacterium]